MIVFKAIPLERYASLNTISLLSLIGIKSKFLPLNYSIVLDFNLKTSLQQHPKAKMTFHVRDSEIPSEPRADFCIANVTRWRLDISDQDSFMGYLQKMKRKHYVRYEETQKAFTKYGATLSIIEGDWSQYADEVHKLYLKVAEKHGTQMYDLDFFHTIAKRSDYKLMCAWYDKSLIGALVMVDEQPVFHSMVCGLDYSHSKNSHTYAQMHYEFIRFAIESKKFNLADVGITANDAKSMLDFEPVKSSMDVFAHGWFLRNFLRMMSYFFTATINAKARLELSLRKKMD